jgi:anti-sigma regulatory factor (Ser/Thr protein kinase)
MKVETHGLSLLNKPKSASAARDWIGDLDLPLPEERLHDLRVAVNELVTNAIRHAETDISVLVTMRPFVVRVEVIDGSGGEPEVQHPSWTRTGGRGLAIVDALADRWGHHGDAYTRVWAEFYR